MHVPTFDEVANSSMLFDGPPSITAWLLTAQTNTMAFIMGDCGFGKTAIPEAFAEVAGREFFPFYGDQSIVEDFGGYKYLSDFEYNEIKFPAMKSAPDYRFVKSTVVDSVVLFDEVTNCNDEIQAAMLGLACNPPDCCWPLAAGNDPAVAANGHALTRPMVNRMWIGDLVFDWQAWDAGQSVGNFPVRKLPIIPETWESFYPKWGLLSVLFRHEHSECMGKEQTDKKAPAWDGLPYPSPRSWHNGMRALAAADSVGAPGEVRTELLRGFVGSPAATQFWSWMSSQSLPTTRQLFDASESDIQDLLRPFNGSQLLVIANCCVNEVVVLGDNNTAQYQDEWERCQKVLKCFSQIGYEEIAQLVYNKLFLVTGPGRAGKEVVTYPGNGFRHEHTVLDRNRAATAVYIADQTK